MSYSDNASSLNFINHQHNSQLVTRLHDQRATGLFCDVVLHVGSQMYLAHKNFLAATSLYFESLFLKELLTEKDINADVVLSRIHVAIDVDDVCPETFSAVLDYMYLGEISVDAMVVRDVFKLANQFLLDSLKDYCFVYLECEHKSQNTCKSIPSMSDTTKIPEVLQNDITHEINTEDGFQKVPKMAMLVLKSELQSDNVESEQNSVLRGCDNELTRNSKRQYPARLNKNLLKRNITTLDAPRITEIDEEIVFIREPVPIDTVNICESRVVNKTSEVKVKDSISNPNFVRKSSSNKLVLSNCQTRQVTNRKLHDKFKLNRSVSASQFCHKSKNLLECNVNEECKPEIKIMEDGIDDDTQPYKNNTFTSKIIRMTVRNFGLKKKRQKRGRPRKVAAVDERTFTSSESATRFSCFWCSYRCKWTRELVAHVASLHFPQPPYNCDGCHETFDLVEQLIKHRKIHLELERPFECSTCNKRFKLKNTLMQHLRCHTGERTHTCPVCGHAFTTKATLDQHIITHSDQRPYLCHLCGFATQYQSLLIEHRRVHNGEMFCCDVPNCKYSTTRRTQLARHTRSHLKIRQHVCSKCAQAFVEKSHLVRHERLHLDARPFKCDRCPFDCNRPEYLKVHQKKCCPDVT